MDPKNGNREELGKNGKTVGCGRVKGNFTHFLFTTMSMEALVIFIHVTILEFCRGKLFQPM